MTQVECPSCGAAMLVPAETEKSSLVVECPHCQARLRIEVASQAGNLGSATIFQPQLLSEGFADTRGVPPGRASRNTAVTDPVVPTRTSSPLELKVEAELIVKGAGASEGYRLKSARTVVGRTDADITVDDPTLSGRHFEVEVRGTEFFLRDLDSSNGTLLNGRKIQTAELSPGDKIIAGRTVFVFECREVIPWDAS